MGKLTDRQIQALAPRERPYKAMDGGGLYLLVMPNGARYWRLDFQLDGKRGTAALGVYSRASGERGTMPLVKARAERDRCRGLLARKIRPTDAKVAAAAEVRERADVARAQARADRQARNHATEVRKALRRAEHWSVERVCEAWALDHSVGLATQTVRQTRQSLEDHVYPLIGAKPITSITTADIIDVLDRILSAGKVETARKVRRRLAAVWQFAVLKHYTKVDVVAPTSRETTKRIKAARIVHPVEHLACVNLAETPALMRAIRGYTGSPVTRAALLMLAYTFARTGEVRAARWSEFELDGKAPTWVIPAARMKVKRRGDRVADPHIVALSRQAVAVLRELRELGLDSVYVFPHSRKAGRVMSENTCLFALWELGWKGRMTGHGFRSLASTILHEAGFDSVLVEAQLAHEKKDPSAAAYDRSQHLERRRLMMQRYADMLDADPAGNVPPLLQIA